MVAFSAARFKGKFQPIEMPSPEMMYTQDMMDNCGVKSVIAGIMGCALGVAFGIFTASLDTGVSEGVGQWVGAAQCCKGGV